MSDALLLDAYAFADIHKAQSALDAWLNVTDVESEINPINSRLLGWLAKERPDLQFSMGVAPRVRGLSRLLWADQQRALSELRQLQRDLSAAGIHAILPAELAPDQLALCWDRAYPELYVPESDCDSALTYLLAHGWQNKDHRIPRSRFALISSLRLWGGENHHVRLRWKLLDRCCAPEADAAVWANATGGWLRHIDVLLWLAGNSSPETMMLSLADALRLIHAGIDWDHLLNQAQERQSVLCLKRFLAPLCHAIAPDIQRCIEAMPVTELEQREAAFDSLWLRYRRLTDKPTLWGFASFMDRWVGISYWPELVRSRLHRTVLRRKDRRQR